MPEHEPSTGPRPSRRPWHSTTALDDFAIVTWAVPLDRIAAAIPDGFEPEPFDLGDGPVGLASVVSFRDRDFRFRGAPFVRMACGQVNHRLYVRRGGEPGVWFLGTSLDHRLVRVAQVLWSLPWHRESVDVRATWDGDGCTAMTAVVDGDWGALDITLGGPCDGVPDALRSPLVTDPLVGWYPRRDDRLGRYTVWHPPIDLVPVAVERAQTAPFERAGLVEPGQPPVGALVTPVTVFDVHTPPRRLRAGVDSSGEVSRPAPAARPG